MAQGNASLAFRYFGIDVLWGIVRFPAWWYTRGLAIVLAWTLDAFRSANASFGFTAWLRNIFVPMYGETEWTGRLISFGVRCFMIFFRGLGVLGWGIGAFALFAAYLAAPLLAVAGILFNGFGSVIASV